MILPGADFLRLAGEPRGPELPPALMARKLIRSRQALGWSQVELARRAGVRPETNQPHRASAPIAQPGHVRQALPGIG
ncbi:MAG TPA: hypothetical protein VNH11_31710 [Pirellulales bacterium]|nr:hypothetical protein [Pirellulales bacterium]